MISLKGLTPYQAFARIEQETGKQPPDEVKALLRSIVGLDGKFGEAQFVNDDDEIGVLISMDTDEKREGAAKAIHELEFVNSDFGRKLQDEVGPPPEYNGGVGDSCDCISCNYRRKINGMDLAYDFIKGLTRTESENCTVENYAKIGKTVPTDKNTDAGRHAFDVIKDEVLNVLDQIKSDKPIARYNKDVKLSSILSDKAQTDVAALAKLAKSQQEGARIAYKEMVNGDPAALADFDRLADLNARSADITIREYEEMGELLNKVFKVVLNKM